MTPRPATLDAVARAIKAHEGHTAPGGMVKVLSQLSLADQHRVYAAADTHDNERELGKHGDPTRVSRVLEVPQEIVDKVVDGLNTDYVTMRLQERKSDADMPLPELTRRDAISAAFDSLE